MADRITDSFSRNGQGGRKYDATDFANDIRQDAKEWSTLPELRKTSSSKC
jgi:hypothetical protein